MKKYNLPILAFTISLLYSGISLAQCASEINVYGFPYNGNNYEVVSENKTWAEAFACAVERGGYLIEINDANEQAMIFPNLPFINFQNTSAPDGGNGGYLWIGGNDFSTEGSWVWDGDNDGIGTPFWMGDASGSPVGGAYTNWGNEPDNFGNGQDALAYAITNWPMGLQEEWNDVSASNSLYYIIEYTAADLNENTPSSSPKIAPNPAESLIRIQTEQVESIVITDINGALISEYKNLNSTEFKLNISDYPSGIYFFSFYM